MRKSIFAWSAVAVAAIATLSCQKEANFIAPESEGVTIHVLADDTVTKTAAVDGETPSIQWSEGDKIKIYEIVDDVVGANAESDEAVISAGKASFTATLSGEAQGASFKYSAVYPASAVDKSSGNNSFYRIKMPKDQTLKGNNFSEDSDLLFSTVLDHGSSRVANNESVQFSFRRLGTVVRLQLVGITAGEKIQKVILTAPVNMAGRVKYDPATGTISDAFYDSTTNSKVITLTVSDELLATGNDVVWFRVIAERDWGEENDKIGVEVETDKANYYRNGLDADHALIDSPVIEFIDGGLTKFGFNLASYRVEKPSATVYTKVEDAAQIVDGGEYLITAVKDPKTYTMGAYNNSYYAAVEVTESEGSISITSEQVTVVTLEDAGDGEFYIKVPVPNEVSENGYQHLAWSSGNSVRRADKETTDEFKWTVTPTSISNVGTPARLLQYNAGSPRFACYTSAQTAIQLYVNPETVSPVAVNTITLSGVDNDNKIYLDAVGGVAYFTVTADADWTTNVNIENGDFSIDPENGQSGSTEIEVSADEDNTGAERQMGTITITCGKATKTVYVIQNAGAVAPAKGTQENPYTVAEALDVISGLEENGKTADKFYVSGIVSEIGSISSNALTYYISDDGTTTSQLQVYKGKYVNGANFTSAELIETGDQVVVYGNLQDYQSTPEISQNSIIYSLNGLTTALELAQPTLSYNEANKQITVTWTAATGSNSEISYVITCGTQDYGPVTAAGSHTFTMQDYGSYSVAVTATAADAAKAIATAQAVINDPAVDNGDGLTPETAFNIAGVKAYIDGQGSDRVYIKGKISSIVSAYATDFGNGTFWISDDGSSDEFEAYRALYLGNRKWEEGDTQIAVGDDVILYGNVTKYGSIYETSSGNAYLYSLNGVVYPTITVSDISGIDAAGVTTTTNVTFTDNAGWTASVTPDGTVVTAASISGSTITYTVGANTGGARNGKITVSLTKGARTISAEISVSQMPGTTGGGEVTDILNRALTGVTGTSYSEWSGKMSNSSAVYAGQSAGGNESIQLRSNNNNSGIVTTASGGKVTKIVVTWNSNTADGRTLNIYGKESAYTAATDLYDANKQGTLLGTIVKGTSTELTVSGDYEFIGLRSNSGAMYIEQIQIIWN